jgi:uncharacterized protein YjgD (DUF1641 family)
MEMAEMSNSDRDRSEGHGPDDPDQDDRQQYMMGTQVGGTLEDDGNDGDLGEDDPYPGFASTQKDCGFAATPAIRSSDTTVAGDRQGPNSKAASEAMEIEGSQPDGSDVENMLKPPKLFVSQTQSQSQCHASSSWTNDFCGLVPVADACDNGEEGLDDEVTAEIDQCIHSDHYSEDMLKPPKLFVSQTQSQSRYHALSPWGIKDPCGLAPVADAGDNREDRLDVEVTAETDEGIHSDHHSLSSEMDMEDEEEDARLVIPLPNLCISQSQTQSQSQPLQSISPATSQYHSNLLSPTQIITDAEPDMNSVMIVNLPSAGNFEAAVGAERHSLYSHGELPLSSSLCNSQLSPALAFDKVNLQHITDVSGT